MKKIFLYIKWFFVSIFLGGDKIKATEKYVEPQAVSTISKEQHQEELAYLLSDECSVAYDPYSSEAIAEINFMNGTFNDSFGFFGIEPVQRGNIEDGEPTTILEGKEGNTFFNKRVFFNK